MSRKGEAGGGAPASWCGQYGANQSLPVLGSQPGCYAGSKEHKLLSMYLALIT